MKGLWLSIFLLATLSGCMTVRAEAPPPAVAVNAPEDAVFDWMRQQPSEVAHSVAIRQIVEIDRERNPVLASFRPDGWEYALPALALFEVDRKGERWATSHVAYSAEPTLRNDAITFYSGPYGASRTSTATFGLVVDERVTQVAILWSDGLEQIVRVQNGSYISVRTDSDNLAATRVTALDAKGETLATFDNGTAGK